MPRVKPGTIVRVARCALSATRSGNIGRYTTPGGNYRFAWRLSDADEWEFEFGDRGHVASHPEVAAAFLASRALRVKIVTP